MPGDPAGALVDPAWLEGGVDRDGILSPGCYDTDRGFMQWPAGVSGLLDYVTIDPSAGNFWGVEWWAIQPQTKVRYLIRGLRSSKFRAGDLVQWDTSRGDLSGLMQEWQAESMKLGHRIRCWVIEGNSAFKHLTQYDHFRAWQRRWGAAVILHQTQRNKWDEATGIEALLPPLYRQGLKRLPKRQGDLDALGFVTKFTKELTQYPVGDQGSRDGGLAGRVEHGSDPRRGSAGGRARDGRREAPQIPAPPAARGAAAVRGGLRVRALGPNRDSNRRPYACKERRPRSGV